jgi:glyoxylase-like metal-dependent hydrolase (beta-lactamase superfamily II)
MCGSGLASPSRSGRLRRNRPGIDPMQAVRTRKELFARFAGTPTLILGGHFVGGTIVRNGDAFRLAI